MRIDLHADTPLWQHWLGYDFCRAHRPWLPAGAWLSNLDLPRMQQGGLDAQMFGLVSLPFEYDGLATVERMIRLMNEAAQRSAGRFVLVRNGSELRAAKARGARAGILSIEGVHALRGQLSRADRLIDAGVVSFGLAHFHRNAACDPAFGLGASAHRGLSAFGQDLVAYLHSRGCIVDLTHINHRGFFAALDASPKGPFMVSHTGVRGAYDLWRNLDDAQIRAVAERGGVVGVMVSRHFLGGNDLRAVARHILHVVRVGGRAAAALGSDFDGFVVPVRGLRDIRGLPALAEVLRREGLSAAEVDDVLGGNAARFLTEALG